MTTLNRRDFLKALGVTGSVSTISACGLDTNNYLTPVERILPYVVKPDQVTPGTPTFFATSVLRGPHAHAVTARHRDGRVINVSHNRFAPGRPSVSSAELFELQKHYSPDRLKGPLDGGAATTWDAGTAKLGAAVQAAVAAGKKVAYLGGYKSGAIVTLLQDFTAGNAVFWEPTGYDADVAAAKALFGQAVVPFYGFDKAGYVLSFGAPFLSGWGDADASDRYATARDPNVDHRVVRFALVSPHRDQTGANADDWHACAPGAQVVVARAVAALVADKKAASGALKALIGSVSVDEASSASGIPAAQIEAMAEHFVSMDGLAVPGGAAGGTDLAAAVYLLNLAGGAAPERFHLGGYQGPVSSFADLQGLIADLQAGRVGVLLLDDANPVYALPDAVGFADAVGKADLVVSVSSHPDETTSLASLVLPASDTFEDWGDEAPRAGLRILRQPSQSPLYDTRSLGDVLLAVGRQAGLVAPSTAAAAPVEAAPEGEVTEPVAAAVVGLGFGPTTWREYVAATWQKDVWDGQEAFDAFWRKSVIEGVHVTAVENAAPALVTGSYPFAAAAPVSGLALHAYEHPHRKDGRYANQPWAQEVPDPMHGQVWDSWLEVNEATAKANGLKNGGLVQLAVGAATVEIGVQVTRAAADGVVALAFGQGHTGAGRYADNYGVNVAKLFGAAADAAGALSWGAVAATVKDLGKRADLVSTFSQFGTSDEQRNFGVHVSAEKIAAVGDAPAAHPGELTGIHHLAMDSRLEDRKVDGFYGTPDHPTYRFGMTVDVNACTGCGACSVACYAENNLPIVGKAKIREGREMGWIRINRYWEEDIGGTDDIRFVPMMCQHCGHAGCENVCPVLATYHNLDGLNAMVYNRCVGTRYCSNACPFSARRFNYHTYGWPEPFNLQLNPDVSTREMGVMEKCTFCVQRLRQTKSAWKDTHGFTAEVPDEVWRTVPACVEACPSQALTFGNLKDPEGACSKSRQSARTYEPLEDLRPLSAVNYLAKASFHDDPTAHHGGGHGGSHSDAGEHAAEADHAGGSDHHEEPAAHGEGH